MFKVMVCDQGAGKNGGIYITGSMILCIILEPTLGSVFLQGIICRES
jgi:hypothetical protein